MKQFIFSLFILVPSISKANSLNLINASLKAAQYVRVLHIKTELLSIKDYATIGSVEINKTLSSDESKALYNFEITYMGPADMCKYIIQVKKNIVLKKSSNCN